MPDRTCHPSCAHWSRLPWGSGGYKAGTCAVSGRTTLAPHGCDSWAERPNPFLAPGTTPMPIERLYTRPISATESAGATQGGLFDG